MPFIHGAHVAPWTFLPLTGTQQLFCLLSIPKLSPAPNGPIIMTCIKSLTCRLLFPLLCLLCAPSWAETVIFETTYEGKIAGFSIDTERRLVKLDDGSYQLKSEASNFLGSLTEISHFTKQGDDWRPLRYVYKRRILGAKTTETIDFNWDKMTAEYTRSDEPERNSSHQLVQGVLDPALYQLRMQGDLLHGVEDLDYRFVKRDRIRHYEIERSATEEVSVRDKKYPAVKLQRSNSDDDAKQTYVWAMPGMDYIFGKIIHVEDDGDTHQMILTHYKINQERLRAFFGPGAETPPTAVTDGPSSVRPEP